MLTELLLWLYLGIKRVIKGCRFFKSQTHHIFSLIFLIDGIIDVNEIILKFLIFIFSGIRFTIPQRNDQLRIIKHLHTFGIIFLLFRMPNRILTLTFLKNQFILLMLNCRTVKASHGGNILDLYNTNIIENLNFP